MQIGVCTHCGNVVDIKKKTLYFECDRCHQIIVSSDAIKNLDELCTAPKFIEEMLGKALELEEQNEIEKALGIIAALRAHHEYNEQIAFTHVRMSGYDVLVVGQYLKTFAAVKGEKPFAAEFLDNVMDMRYIMLLPQLIAFADNKLPSNQKRKYRGTLEGMRLEYTSGTSNENGINVMYAYYITASVINAILFVVFFIVHIHFAFHLLILLGAFAVEFFLLFLHNRVYGNRLGISDFERILMLVFMSSIPFAIGGAIMGALV
jgi:predicted RNA-binding Zn-ribbon protein involved in translation (DUF1610 family)